MQIIITKPRIVAAVVVIWSYSAIVNFSPLVLNWNNWVPGIPCDLALVYPKLFLLVFIVLSIFIILIVISFLYASIFKVLLDRKKGIQCNDNFSEIVQKQKVKIIERDTKVLKGLVIVVAAYAICLVPMCIVLVISVYSPSLRVKLSYARMVTNIATILNSGFNPVIYNIRLKQFKDAFRELLHLKPRREESDTSSPDAVLMLSVQPTTAPDTTQPLLVHGGKETKTGSGPQHGN